MADIDPSLIARVADSLDDNTRAVAQLTDNQRRELEKVSKRLEQIELILHGTAGAHGIAVQLESLRKDVDAIKASKDHENRGSQHATATRLTIVMTIIAIVSLVGTCGPQLVRGWVPQTEAGK